jgi:uncharacterized membrane protein
MAKDQNVVIAFFASEEAANEASDLLKKWDKANKDIQLGAVGTIYKKDDKIKTKVGHKTGSGARTGAILGVIAAVLSGGITLVGGVVAGGAGGGILGSFFKKSLNLNKEEIASLGAKLDAGQVALVVTCDDNEVEGVSAQLRDSGGTLTTYTVPEEALDEAAEASSELPPVEASTAESASAEAPAGETPTGEAEGSEVSSSGPPSSPATS